MTTTANGVDACAAQSTHFVSDDARRAREFYRYLQPDNLLHPQLRRRGSTFDVHHDHVPSLSTAMVPFCQLAALRCNASKAMLNVMDRDVMYFLAEASMKRTDSGGVETHAFVEDAILLSCSSVPLQGRICELTLKMGKPDDPDQVPTFVIPDLSQSQFADMSIVAGPPHYRFYAGVPITTRDGVNIGSLAIMDTTARPDGLTGIEKEFLGKTAEQIMTFLETNRQALEGRRSRLMAEGLEAFIGGKRSLHEASATALSNKALKKRVKAAYGIALKSDNESGMDQGWPHKHNGLSKMNTRSNSIVSLGSETSSSTLSTDGEEQQAQETEGDSRSHTKTFARAANLLRESLGDLGEEASVHFLSLITRLGGGAQRPRSDLQSTAGVSGVASTTDCNGSGATEGQRRNPPRCQIIASSTNASPTLKEAELANLERALDDEALRDMMRRYPGGHLWILDDTPSSSEEEEDARDKARGYRARNSDGPRRTSRRKRSELKTLRAAFPTAKQVLFSPVWDATVGSFAYACFVTTTLETRSFSSTSELPFLNSFCSTVMAECSRLDTMMADGQKSDFVGTISHEMRSPLHGILASVEFLAETDVTSFQRSLIETVESCGRTLLDTINHVLDFSKVNSFQKQWQAANKRSTHGGRRNNYLGPDNSSRAAAFGAPPLLQLFGITDISAVLEEVVDGLVLGHTYNSGLDITDTSREARGRALRKTSNPTTRPDPVEILLNVQQGDWNFMTQPGAVRRIIMNITGNAIKYTSHGTIKVQLQQRNASDENADTRIIMLSVTDTGKGISPEFLASRLFVPFAQENALAPGTGLGLSIVRSIVLMLGGTIDVQSRVGEGTTVEVVIPMKRPLPGQMSTQNTPHSGGTGVSGHSTGDDSILLLQNQAAGETVSLYRPKPGPDDSLVNFVQQYVREWYHLEYIDEGILENSSVVLVEEEDLEHLTSSTNGTPGKRPAFVIMCSVSSWNSTAQTASLEQRLSSPVEFVTKPCGPNKLARAIRQALEKVRTMKPRFAQVPNLGVIPEATTPGVSISPSTACDPAGNELQEMDVSGEGEFGMVVQASETFAASQVSQNAQMAIHDPSAALRTPKTQMSDHDAFPFPVQAEEKSRQRRETNRSRHTSFTGQSGAEPCTPAETSSSEPSQITPTTPAPTKIDPHVLLVDDNKINLRLLDTFLKRKRNYTHIEQAENGQQAVDAVVRAREPYDIIFMDISMPVMNGFEATRAIRTYEEQCSASPGVMVIALTGLASGRDQTEGFDSGCDIYMTKPVSFKEVGRLLDNWEGHQRANLDQEIILHENLTKLNLKLSPDVNIAVEINGD